MMRGKSPPFHVEMSKNWKREEIPTDTSLAWPIIATYCTAVEGFLSDVTGISIVLSTGESHE